MSWRSILSISVMTVLGLELVPSGTVAQQRTLKEQLIGAWTLVSCDSTEKNGERVPFCVNPRGILILDASGRYAKLITARDRPKFTTANRSETSAEEYKAAALGVGAVFGTWSISEAEKTVTFHREGSLVPQVEGTDQKNSIILAGEELKLVTQNAFFNGGNEEMYRRAK
jgi:hypothetical protein